MSQLSGKSNQRVGVHSAQSPRQAENDETGTPTILLSVIVLRPSKGLLSFFNRHVLSYMLWRCLRVKRYCACARTLLPLSVSVLLSALSTEQICASWALSFVRWNHSTQVDCFDFVNFLSFREFDCDFYSVYFVVPLLIQQNSSTRNWLIILWKVRKFVMFTLSLNKRFLDGEKCQSGSKCNFLYFSFKCLGLCWLSNQEFNLKFLSKSLL